MSLNRKYLQSLIFIFVFLFAQLSYAIKTTDSTKIKLPAVQSKIWLCTSTGYDRSSVQKNYVHAPCLAVNRSCKNGMVIVNVMPGFASCEWWCAVPIPQCGWADIPQNRGHHW